MFGMNFLLPYFVCLKCEGSGRIVQIRKLSEYLLVTRIYKILLYLNSEMLQAFINYYKSIRKISNANWGVFII